MSTYTPIASQTLGSAAASVTFSSIPQGYTDLRIVINTASNVAAFPFLRFNSDTGSNYSLTELLGNGSSASSSRGTNMNLIQTFNVNTTTAIDTMMTWDIMNYSNSTTYKTVLLKANAAGNGTNAIVGLWRNTAAITSIYIGVINSGVDRTFSAGSTFSLYGIQVGTAAQKAQGGNIVTSDGTYVYHTFTSSGSFTANQALTVDYLVVAGGGGGGCNSNYDQGVGGGGGGGYRTSIGGTALSVTAKSYPVIVGAGGLGSTNTYSNGSNGNDSTFATITSTGGGGGGSRNGASTALAGSNGGSGGGGAGPSAAAGSGNTPSTSPSQGSNGGAAGSHSGGGGGGASATGSAGSGATGGAGGAGTANSISGTSVTYAGGGGGGGGQSSGTGGAGGAGGGAAGGNTSTTGSNAVVNLGGGGGGGGANSGNYYGGNGGSGVVIIRYAI